MFLTSSIILGFVRLCLVLLVLFYLNRKFVNKSDSNNFLEFLVHHWFRYGSFLAIVLFCTVQLGIYNLLNCIIILLLIMAVDLIGIKNLKNYRRYFNGLAKSSLQNILRTIEVKPPTWSWLRFERKENSRARAYFLFFVIVLVAGITFASRYYFFRYDMYSLSGIWLSDLEKVKDYDFQIWFLNTSSISGDLSFVNFYSKFIDVSPEIALQSMAILESTLLAVLLFWLVRKCTPSKHFAPVIAALFFALAYTLTPINIYFLLQNKPIFLALTFGLPTMVYLLRPGLLKLKKVNYFFAMYFAFIAIGLIDLFTLYILFPPFVTLAALFSRRNSRRYYWIGALAYFTGALTVLAISAFVCTFMGTDLEMFLHSGLLAISSYTYIPQLIIPFDQLMGYYQIASGVGIVFLIFFKFYLKENWGGAIVFLLYFNVLLFLGKIESSWIDGDLLKQGLSLFMHIVAAVNVAILIRLLHPILSRAEFLNKTAVTVSVAGLVFLGIYFQRGIIGKLDVAESTPKQILDAYDRISRTFFPFSYAVVNDNSTQAISTNTHFFMNYSDFIYDYPKLDSIYFKNIKDPRFLKKNPQYALPKSVLLFVFDTKPGIYVSDGDISSVLLDQLAMLKNRGRKVDLFYESENVRVYEIINEPGESRITDLIF